MLHASYDKNYVNMALSACDKLVGMYLVALHTEIHHFFMHEYANRFIGKLPSTVCVDGSFIINYVDFVA